MNLLMQAKKDGFADRYLARFSACRRKISASSALRLGVVEGWEAVPVSGVENAAYYYSTYNAPDKVHVSNQTEDHGPGRRSQPDRPGH